MWMQTWRPCFSLLNMLEILLKILSTTSLHPTSVHVKLNHCKKKKKTVENQGNRKGQTVYFFILFFSWLCNKNDKSLTGAEVCDLYIELKKNNKQKQSKNSGFLQFFIYDELVKHQLYCVPKNQLVTQHFCLFENHQISPQSCCRIKSLTQTTCLQIFLFVPH